MENVPKSQGEADLIVTQMAWGPAIEKVYVFEGANFDEMKAPASTVEMTGMWLLKPQKHLQWWAPQESLIAEAHRKINERIHLLKIHSSPQ